MRPRPLAQLVLAAALLAPAAARADDTEDASTPTHLRREYVQYGLAFTGEFVVAPGPICGGTAQGAPCILGSGGGVAIRLGQRLRAPFWLGGAYEFSKQEPGQVYRLAILQQLRAEGRFYIDTGRTTQPYFSATVGGVGYGNLWGLDTGGPEAGLGLGSETQLSTGLVVGFSLTYRGMFLASFDDSGGTHRPEGFAQVLGLDLVLESRDSL